MPSATAAKPSRAAYMRAYRRRKRLEAAEAARDGANLPVVSELPANPARVLAEWSEATLRIPGGHPMAGQPMVLPDYGERFLADALKHRESLMCIGRKNAKSAIVAIYLLGRLAGPLRTPGYRAGVVSVTKEKAQELWLQCEGIANASELPGIRVGRAPKRIMGPDGGVVDFLSADASAGHASGFDDAIADELGLMKERDRDLLNGMRSSVSARNGRFMALSILGDAPFTREMRARRESPTTAVHDYIPPEGCAIDDEGAWHAANPGLRLGIKSLEYMRDEAARCLVSPADERSFRAFDLNQPVDPGRELICSLIDWQACQRAEQRERRGQCLLGLDIGGSNSMTAAVAIWPGTGRVEAWAAFGGVPALRDRGRVDGVGDIYAEMHDEGSLRVFPGHRVTPVAPFMEWVASELAGERIGGVGADRYRRAEVLQALDDAGLRWPMVWRGMGASKVADGSHDVRAFQRMVRSGALSVKASLLWTNAITESEIRYDSGGNPALDKRRNSSRIDVLQAGVIAAGLAALAAKDDGPQLRLVTA